jgi:acyl carrier protein
MDREKLSAEVKSLIIEAVNLQHMTPESIENTMSLYQEGLGLDSVDILEIIVAIENQYKIKVPNAESGKKAFQSVATIVDFIAGQKSETDH